MLVRLTYNLLWMFGSLVAFPWVMAWLLASGKRRKTVFHRLGIAVSPALRQFKHASSAKPLWVHALSVGEVLSAVPLATALKKIYPDRPVVFSTSTLTGHETASRLLQSSLDAITYFPYDMFFSVRSAIHRIDPALVIIVETDIWPNFLFEMRRSRIPVLLVNARLSDRSYSGYKRFLWLITPVFNCFSKVCVQSREDYRRFLGLGLSPDRVSVAGNLKYDAPVDPTTENMAQNLRRIFPRIPHWRYLVAGSTHPGEEIILLNAHARMKIRFPSLCLILAPRDIRRANAICSMAASNGLTGALFSHLTDSPLPNLPDVVVVNTIGHLKSLYALCDLSFVGGSLIDFGGHNPLEPAAFSRPILFGPHTGDVAESCSRLLAAGGARIVHDDTELVHTALSLLQNPEQADTMGKNAFRVLKENQGAMEKILNTIRQFVDDDIP